MSRSVTTDIEDCLSLIAEREAELGKVLQEEAEAEHRYDMKYARAYLNADGTIDARKAIALEKCDAEYLDHLKKKAVKEFVRAKLKDSQDALSARQSLLKYETLTNFGYANNQT